MTSVLRRNAANTARTKPTTGDIKQGFVNVDHLGWLLCDGRQLDKRVYNLLFQVIGYTFGGSGNLFNLPDPRGRVIGSVGTIMDQEDEAHIHNFAPGDRVGEVDHQLSIAEMPAHNHDYSTGSTGNNTTANGTTSTDGTHNHGITDPGHAHSYFNQPNTASPAVSLSTMDVADNNNVNQTTGSSTTGITINNAGAHTHQIASNGGNQYHNNMQPTLFYGNTFIYCGIPMTGSFPMVIGANPVLL